MYVNQLLIITFWNIVLFQNCFKFVKLKQLLYQLWLLYRYYADIWLSSNFYFNMWKQIPSRLCSQYKELLLKKIIKLVHNRWHLKYSIIYVSTLLSYVFVQLSYRDIRNIICIVTMNPKARKSFQNQLVIKQ